jgi:hypothetical protein
MASWWTRSSQGRKSGSSSLPSGRATVRTKRLRFEPLEDRQLLSVMVYTPVESGTMSVTCGSTIGVGYGQLLETLALNRTGSQTLRLNGTIPIAFVSTQNVTLTGGTLQLGAGTTVGGTLQITPGTGGFQNQPVVQFESASQSQGEEEGALTVRLVAQGNLTNDVTVPLTISGTAADGTDYTLENRTVTIPKDRSSASVTIQVNDDNLVEADETIVLALGTPTGAVLGAVSQHTATITSNDQASLSIDNVTKAEGKSGTTDFTFAVTLSGEVDAPFTVDFGTANGTARAASDYIAASGALQFSGASGESRMVTVRVIGDSKTEYDESFLVNLATIDAGGRNVVASQSSAVGTITNDDRGVGLQDNGDLLVIGNDRVNDAIAFQPSGNGQITVQMNGKRFGPYQVTGRLVAYGGTGNDSIAVNAALAQSAFLYGGAGNDKLLGGSGNDVLVGGDGGDQLTGGLGRNLLIAGKGVANPRQPNVLMGTRGENILIAGWTDYDANDAALAMLLAEWSRTDANYAVRVAHLRGTFAGGLNGDYKLTAATIHDNGVRDGLYGQSGGNWYLAHTAGSNTNDVIHGRKAKDRLDRI